MKNRYRFATANRKTRRILLIGIPVIVLSFVASLMFQPSVGLSAARSIDKITGCTHDCSESWVFGHYYGFTPSAETGGIFDANSGKPTESWGAEKPVLAASIAKLFTIGYSRNFFATDDVVTVDMQTLRLVQANSSVAQLKAGKITMGQLYAAMLVPSGNDAAYAVAVATARKAHGANLSPAQALPLFREGIAGYLNQRGYLATRITDPAGYSESDITSAADVALVTSRLLKEEWFSETIKEFNYQTLSPGGVAYSWTNTNQLLNPDSPFYDSQVCGVKTGTWLERANLVTLFKGVNNNHIVIVFGSRGNDARYQDTKHLLRILKDNRR